MDYDNALGLTFRSEPAPLPAEVDWDSVTVVSLQSIADFDHKILSFPARLLALGRWGARAPGRIGSSAWKRAGMFWRTRCVRPLITTQNTLPLDVASACGVSGDGSVLPCSMPVLRTFSQI